MSKLSSIALSVSPPLPVYERASVVVTEEFMLPAAWHTSYISVSAETEDFYVALVNTPDAAPPGLVLNPVTVSLIVANEIQPAVGGAWWLQAGTERHYDLTNITVGQNGRIWLAHISLIAGTGHLRIAKTSGPVGV